MLKTDRCSRQEQPLPHGPPSPLSVPRQEQPLPHGHPSPLSVPRQEKPLPLPSLRLCPRKRPLPSSESAFSGSLSFFVIFNTSPLFFSRPRPCPALSDPCATLSLSGLGWLTAVAASTKAFLATARASALPCRTLPAAASLRTCLSGTPCCAFSSAFLPSVTAMSLALLRTTGAYYATTLRARTSWVRLGCAMGATRRPSPTPSSGRRPQGSSKRPVERSR